MIAECYLVIGKRKKHVTVIRATQRKPTLLGDEAAIHLKLDLPDDVFEAPLFTVPVQKREIAVAVEVKEAA
jgi:hypothetical protein